MKKVAFRNLGCKVNEYELEYMLQKIAQKGYEIVPFDTKADIYIINTCTVTNIADRKSRQMIHKARKENPEAVVVALGCYVQTDTKGAINDGAADIMIGNNRKSELVEIIEDYLSSKNDLDNKKVVVDDLTFEDKYEAMSIERTNEHTRAFIKIQDGCNQFCSYCAIPLSRGRIRSRQLNDILKECNDLAENGYKEVVLTGIHLSSYGIDFHKDKAGKISSYNELAKNGGYTNYDFLEVIEKVSKIEGIRRIRLGSLEPRLITEEFVNRISLIDKVCPHFHLSLQSGCDETLKRMNRKYTTDEYRKAVSLLRKSFKNPAITTDVIVGFPGETEEEFLMTKKFLEEIRFFELHVFKYSRRKGTTADKMKEQVSDLEKEARSNELIKLDKILSDEYRKSYEGCAIEVLFEEEKNGEFYGHSKEYIEVHIQSDKDITGQIQTLFFKG